MTTPNWTHTWQSVDAPAELVKRTVVVKCTEKRPDGEVGTEYFLGMVITDMRERPVIVRFADWVEDAVAIVYTQAPVVFEDVEYAFPANADTFTNDGARLAAGITPNRQYQWKLLD